MPKITIDGQELTVAPGVTVIQAAEMAGIFIPRYCYHPGLSIAGSCRMCLVEVEGMPVLQIACNTRVQDGMKVSTDTQRVKTARQGMLEFLLSNHPLDCPVCDQSGECDLQNFYMEHGRYQSRFLENKVKKKKAFPIGPHVTLDQERCILCTRCTRFTEEVSRSHELGVFNRGSRSVIDLYPGKTLDNPYSGNVIDICPVGALTERDFRFQCRVWYLSTRDSVCHGCARGCNISVHYNVDRPYKAQGRRVMRIKPRFHPEINRWWICDHGRFDFRFHDLDRIEGPALRSDGRLQPADWEQALHRTAEALTAAIRESGPESVGVILSPQLSCEELLYCRALFVNGLGLEQVAFSNPWEEPGPEDELLMKADRNPNTWTAERLGLKGDTRTLLEGAARGRIRLLYVFRHQFSQPEPRELLSRVPGLIYQGTNWGPAAQAAAIVLAGATHVEKSGTFVNFEGRVQRFHQALAPLEDSRQDVDILTALAARLQVTVPASPESMLAQWAGVPVEDIGPEGLILAEVMTA
jgi:NADH-quinone oxidoreductase subunit G